ncbi:MAG: hypothetical protein ACK46L_05020 [Synechococcaceae cyanobacterium]|jgi:hypothetical protein
MDRQHLVTLVDHQKPFKGTWEIYRDASQHYIACHHANHPSQASSQTATEATSWATSQTTATAESCQELGSERQACAFTSQLQFNGWSIENHDPSCQEFRLACHL